MHDAIQGYPTWSGLYGGRAITHQGIVDLEKGAPLEEVVTAFQKARDAGDESRLVSFAYVVKPPYIPRYTLSGANIRTAVLGLV